MRLIELKARLLQTESCGGDRDSPRLLRPSGLSMTLARTQSVRGATVRLLKRSKHMRNGIHVTWF